MEETPEHPTPIHYTRRIVHTVESWPKRTAFTEEYLTKLRPSHVIVDGDTVSVFAHNGVGVYELKRDEPMHGDGIVADLVDGETPSVLKRRLSKYENPARGAAPEPDGGG